LAGAAARADKLVVVAGGGEGGPGSPALMAKLVEPFGVAFDKAGNMYIIELSGQRLLRADTKGVVTLVAGTLSKKGYEGDGGPAAKALFNGAHSLAIAPNDDIYIADTWNNCVRKIDARTGTISTVAGTGQKGDSRDGGPATKAQLGGIYCVALDARGEKLYLADLDNRRIRMVQLDTGIITTVAGNGQKGVPKDGDEAKSAPLVDPRAVAVDAKGNVYVLERSGHALRVVDPAGKIRTVAGASGKSGATGDGGDAKQAALNGPKHLCIDLDGNVLIADAENNLVRKYLPAEGKIVRVAGTGKRGSGGAGSPPEQAEVARPHGVYVHPSGVVYITDSYNNRIVKIER
jgi:sugar lactone lactonase YvrE